MDCFTPTGFAMTFLLETRVFVFLFQAMTASIGKNLWSFALSLENTTPILYKKGVRVRCVYLNGALDLPQTDKRKRPAPQKGDRTAKSGLSKHAQRNHTGMAP